MPASGVSMTHAPVHADASPFARHDVVQPHAAEEVVALAFQRRRVRGRRHAELRQARPRSRPPRKYSQTCVSGRSSSSSSRRDGRGAS